MDVLDDWKNLLLYFVVQKCCWIVAKCQYDFIRFFPNETLWYYSQFSKWFCLLWIRKAFLFIWNELEKYFQSVLFIFNLFSSTCNFLTLTIYCVQMVKVTVYCNSFPFRKLCQTYISLFCSASFCTRLVRRAEPKVTKLQMSSGYLENKELWIFRLQFQYKFYFAIDIRLQVLLLRVLPRIHLIIINCCRTTFGIELRSKLMRKLYLFENLANLSWENDN